MKTLCLYLNLSVLAHFGIRIHRVYGSYSMTPASEGAEDHLSLCPKTVCLTGPVDGVQPNVFQANQSEMCGRNGYDFETCLYKLSTEDVADLARLGWIYNPDNFSSDDPRWSHRTGKEGYDVPRPWCFEAPTDECEEKVREYLSQKYKYFRAIFETCREHGATSKDRLLLLGKAEIL